MSVIGRIMTIGDAILFYERVLQAEKVMGKLTEAERLVILKDFGKEVSREEFEEMLKDKKILRIKKGDGHDTR